MDLTKAQVNICNTLTSPDGVLYGNLVKFCDNISTNNQTHSNSNK